MKKVLTNLSVVFVSTVMLSSCGGKAEKIKVSNLDDACDHVEALITINEAILDIINDENYIYDMSMEEMRKKDYLEYKMMMVQSHARDQKIEYDELKDCDKWQELEDLQDKIDDARNEASRDSY